MIRLSTFRWVPPFAQGLVRDLRVRWALEEAGLSYEMCWLGLEARESPTYREMQPFGQVPVFEEDGLRLFESGAIVQHIAARSAALLPPQPAARSRAITWMFAALNSVEPAIQDLAAIDLFHAAEPWAAQRRPGAENAVRARLADLARWLDCREYLDGDFSAGDLLMTTVLRILRHTELVAQYPRVADYVARCESRPAFRKALRDHLEPFASTAAS